MKFHYLILCLLSFNLWAISKDKIQQFPIKIDTHFDSTILHGVRYANPGKPRILLQHGFMENTRSWKAAGEALHELGYDVFMVNFRGHGNGTHRSKNFNAPEVNSKGQKINRYRFEYIAAYDVPAIVDHVYRVDGKIMPVTYIGHSMGGMAMNVAAAGIIEVNNKMMENETIHFKQNPESGIELAKKLKGVMTFGTPTRFENDYWVFKLAGISNELNLNPEKMSNVLKTFIGGPSPFRSDSMRPFLGLKKKLIENFGPIVTERVLGLAGIINPRNFPGREYADFVDKAISPVEKETLESAIHWALSGYKSLSNKINFAALEHPEFLKWIAVTSPHDKLAIPAHVAEDLAKLKNSSNTLFIEISKKLNLHHVDLTAAKKAVDVIVPLMAIAEKSGFDFDTMTELFKGDKHYRSIRNLGCDQLLK